MSTRTTNIRRMGRACAPALAAAALLTFAACSKQDATRTDSAAAMAPATAGAPAASTAASTDTALKAVRGTIAAVSDTALTLTTRMGPEEVRIVAPLHVYHQTKSDLAHVTPNTFVGITSVAQPDGSERATEIHIFPEELRGVGEGSRMMQPAPGSSANARMTNGAVSQSPQSRMTNGSVASKGGTTYTVKYQGGTQTIVVPPGVTVTAIAPVQTKPAVGERVIVLAHSAPNGQLNASGIMLSPDSTRK